MKREEQVETVGTTGRGPGVEVSRLEDDFGTALEAERRRRGGLSEPSTSRRGAVVDGACNTAVDGRALLLRRVLRGLGEKEATEAQGVEAPLDATGAEGAVRDSIYARHLSRGFMRYANDVIMARRGDAPEDAQQQGHQEDGERATVLARSGDGGYVVVGTSRGKICVVSSATGKAEVLEPGLSEGRRVGADGELKALAVGKVGKARDTVVVGAGYGSGTVKLWRAPHCSGPAGSQGTSRPSAFVPSAPVVDRHASEIVHLTVMNGFGEGEDGVLLSFDGYGRVVSHLVPKLLGSGSGVAAMMSSGAYSQSIASLSSNIYSSVSSALRGTSLGLPMGSGDSLSAAPGTSVMNTDLLEAVGRVRRVVGLGTRAEKDRVILLTEKAGLVIAEVDDSGKVKVDQVVGFGWENGGVEGGEAGNGQAVLEDSDSLGSVVAACLRRDQTLHVALVGGASSRVVSVQNVATNALTRITCPGAVQDVLFLHHGMFVGVVHYDDASGRTLLTLVPVASVEKVPRGVSEISVVSGEPTSAYSCTDLFDIYAKGSALGGDQASDVMLLTSSGVRCVQLMSWKQKLSSMVASRRFEEALMHSVVLYADNRDEMRHGWPANEANDATEVSKQVMSLLILFVQRTMDDKGADLDELSARILVRLLMDACSLVSEVSAFYRDLPPLLQRSEVAWEAYLDLVLECRRDSSQLAGPMQVPPQIVQSLVERVASSPRRAEKLGLLEEVLLSFEVSSLDLNQVLPLCIKHGLYSVLIYVFTRGMKDFKSPASLLVAKAAAKPACSAARRGLVMKLLVYVYACFEGLSYPLGSNEMPLDDDRDSKTTMRLEMMDFLLFARVEEIRDAVSLWESLGATKDDRSDILAHLEGVSSPVLAFLCEEAARTTLGLLQTLLSGWDGLVSDLEPTGKRPSAQRAVAIDSTLSQVAVDRVVSLLDERGGDANSAKLDFVAGLVSSSRASLPPKATTCVLAALCRSISDANGASASDLQQRLRKNVLDIVTRAPADELNDDVLTLARQAGSAAAEAEVLMRRGAYHDAIRCLINSEVEASRIFAYYKDIAGRGDDKAAAFQKAMLPDFPMLVEVDAMAAAEIAVDLAGHQHKKIIESFENDSSAQFRFLNAVVALLRRRDAGTEDAERRYEASPWITLLKSKAMSNMYIRLMCQFDPESVLGYLQRADYDVEECLECCRANGLRGAQAFLLDKMGDLDAAFLIHLEDVETVNREMVACSTPEMRGELTSRADTACDAAVSLCASLRSPTFPLQGPLEHPEQPHPKYKQLMVAYVRSYAENRESMPAWARAMLTRHIKLVAQRAGHIESMVRHVIDEFHNVPAQDMKDVLVLLLGVCEFEATKVELAASIAQKDVSQALQTAYRACSMGSASLALSEAEPTAINGSR